MHQRGRTSPGRDITEAVVMNQNSPTPATSHDQAWECYERAPAIIDQEVRRINSRACKTRKYYCFPQAGGQSLPYITEKLAFSRRLKVNTDDHATSATSG